MRLYTFTGKVIPMNRTTIMLPVELKIKAEKKAKQMHISLGELMRLATKHFIEKQERKKLDDPLITGDFIIREPGPSDVSSNIDHYLYGGKK